MKNRNKSLVEKQIESSIKKYRLENLFKRGIL